jgi:hypothetical protein
MVDSMGPSTTSITPVAIRIRSADPPREDPFAFLFPKSRIHPLIIESHEGGSISSPMTQAEGGKGTDTGTSLPVELGKQFRVTSTSGAETYPEETNDVVRNGIKTLSGPTKREQEKLDLPNTIGISEKKLRSILSVQGDSSSPIVAVKRNRSDSNDSHPSPDMVETDRKRRKQEGDSDSPKNERNSSSKESMDSTGTPRSQNPSPSPMPDANSSPRSANGINPTAIPVGSSSTLGPLSITHSYDVVLGNPKKYTQCRSLAFLVCF